jgi:hypothetical protein
VAGESHIDVGSGGRRKDGVLDFGTRGLKVFLGRIAPTDENFKERWNLPAALPAMGC